MTQESFIRKNQALVSNDYNALLIAKAKREQAKKVDRLENKLESIENKIDALEKTIRGLIDHE